MDNIYGPDPTPVRGKCSYSNKAYKCSCTLFSCSSSTDMICDTCSHSKNDHKITGHLSFTPRVSPPTSQQSMLPADIKVNIKMYSKLVY